MPRTQFEELVTWAQGANTSALASQLPPGFFPRGRNTFLKDVGQGSAAVGRRKGLTELNTTPITGSPTILGGYHYVKANGNSYRLLVSNGGRLDRLNDDNTLTVVDASAFTAGTYYPTFETANDLCFIANGVEMKKYNGTSVQRVGLVRPAAPTATATAGGAMPVDTWDVAITHYNSNTGQESSRSDFTTVSTSGANLQISVSWTAPSDAQVTHVRVYLRRQSVGQNTYRVTAGATPAPDASTGGFPVATLATVLNVSAAQYAAFITLAPSTTDNEPPTGTWKFPCWHHSRLFFADGGHIYYSEIRDNTPYPESFPTANFDPVSPNDGDEIMGLVSMWGRLWIFKRFSLWVLEGTDPNSWEIKIVSRNHGAPSMRSIVAAEDTLYWWSTLAGPVAFNGEQPMPIGREFLSTTIATDSVAQLQLEHCCSGVHEDTQTVLFAVPEAGASRNTLIIPFSYRAKRFHAEYWNPMDIAAMFTVENADHSKALYCGSYSGQVFSWWAGDDDGVPSGSTKSGTVTAATGTTLSDSTATFTTAGNGLKDRYVYAISSDRSTILRNRISSNTATQLTVVDTWDTTPNTTWTYVVGAIDFEFDTPWLSASEFLKKRFEFLFVLCGSADVGTEVDLSVFTSQNLTEAAFFSASNEVGSGGGGTWDSATWDVTTWGAAAIGTLKKRIGRTGFSWRARVRCTDVDHDLTVYRIAMQSQALSIRR